MNEKKRQSTDTRAHLSPLYFDCTLFATSCPSIHSVYYLTKTVLIRMSSLPSGSSASFGESAPILSDDQLLQQLFDRQPDERKRLSCATRFWSSSTSSWRYVNLKCKPGCQCALSDLRSQVPAYRKQRTDEMIRDIEKLLCDGSERFRSVDKLQEESNAITGLLADLLDISQDGRNYVKNLHGQIQRVLAVGQDKQK